MHPDASRQEYARRLLTEVETGNGTSQRTLARRAGMALGLTNVVLKGLVRSGLVRVTRADGAVRYEITPEGLAENARISTAYFAYTTRFYVEARNRVRERLMFLSQTWAIRADDSAKRVAFYGATEAAEIGAVCVHETDLHLTRIFDGEGRRRLVGAAVHAATQLADPASWCDFDVLIVMSFEDTVRKSAEVHLKQIGFAPERIFWI